MPLTNGFDLVPIELVDHFKNCHSKSSDSKMTKLNWSNRTQYHIDRTLVSEVSSVHCTRVQEEECRHLYHRV